MAESKKARVACLIPNGLMIRLWHKSERAEDAGAIVADGPGIRLNGPSSTQTGAHATQRMDIEPGITEIDAGWMEKWLEQNKASPLVGDRLIYVIEENPTQQK
jgi:hypothetical protein